MAYYTKRETCEDYASLSLKYLGPDPDPSELSKTSIDFKGSRVGYKGLIFQGAEQPYLSLE